VFAAWLLLSALLCVPADWLFGLKAHPRSQELSATVATGLAGLVMIPVCLVVAARRFRGGLKGWGIGRRPFAASALWGAAGFLASWPICWGLLRFSSGVLRAIWPEYHLQVHRVMQVLHWPGVTTATVVWLYVAAIVITPVFEEMLFRGLLQSVLVRLVRQRWGGIVLASAVFGLVHAAQVQAVLPMVVFGLCLGFVYEKSGSLTAAILVHGLFNAKNLLWDALVNA
jgi:membrane protease YdiL (CAAX protease family)